MLEYPFTAASGRLGDAIHSRNRSGQYTRPYVVPVGSQTSYNIFASGLLFLNATRWRTVLTEEERHIWRAWASTHPRPDRLGNLYVPGAYQLWLGTNIYLTVCGSTVQFRTPANTALGPYYARPVAELTAPNLMLVVLQLPRPVLSTAKSGIACFTSPTVSPGTNFYHGPFRFAGRFRNQFGPPTPVDEFVTSRVWQPGDRVFVQFKGMTFGGERGPTYSYPVTVV